MSFSMCAFSSGLDEGWGGAMDGVAGRKTAAVADSFIGAGAAIG